MLKSDDIRDRIKDIDDFLLKQYKDEKGRRRRHKHMIEKDRRSNP